MRAEEAGEGQRDEQALGLGPPGQDEARALDVGKSLVDGQTVDLVLALHEVMVNMWRGERDGEDAVEMVREDDDEG